MSTKSKRPVSESTRKRSTRPAPGANPDRPLPGRPTRPLPDGNPNRPMPGVRRTPPRYIVVFREPSERNVSLLSRIRGVGQTKDLTNLRAGRVVLEAQNQERARTRVYERLAVATSDLSPDELDQVRRSDSVRLVVPNEVRTLPPLRRVITAQFCGELDEASGAKPTRSLEAYLRGMSDAIRNIGAYSGDLILPSTPGSVITPGLRAQEASAAQRHSWCLSAIGIAPSYRRATGQGVTVAVLDTGISFNHPDFAGRFEEGRNAVSFVSGTTAMDRNGHGTHCAGVIAGPVQSAGGRRYGVAPDADLLVGKVLDDEGSGWDDDILEGIDWAAERGARVISMSLGSLRSQNGPAAEAYETVAETLFRTGPGVLLVGAAGNSSERPTSVSPVENPAACPSIFAVAACDRNLQVAWFSCGTMDFARVDLTGPGVAVYSAYIGGRYALLDGTSMATPHAAGVAALHLERNPSFTASDLVEALTASALRLSSNDDFGAGLVQAP